MDQATGRQRWPAYIILLWLVLASVAVASDLGREDDYAEPDRICLEAGDDLRGTIDRSTKTITLVHRTWLTQQLMAKLGEIVLREMLGYTVRSLHSPGLTLNWGIHMSSGIYDVDIEQWYATPGSANYNKYVVTGQSVKYLGTIGYVGRSGLYTMKMAVDQNHNADYYKFYQSRDAMQLGFVQHNESVAPLYGFEWPRCTTDFAPWCGTGEFEGYWAPPVCLKDPDSCIQAVHTIPGGEACMLEQLVRRNGLRVIFSYWGFSALQAEVARRGAEGRPTLFYLWEPDPFLLRSDVQGVRVQMPDYYHGCTRNGNGNANTGMLNCDLPEIALQKLAVASILREAPEVYYFVEQLSITPDQINQLILSTMDDGGGLDNFDAACSFIKTHRALLEAFVPTCITHPIAPDSVQTGDEVFNPGTMQCENATVLAKAAATVCNTQLLPVSADRRNTKIRLVRRMWLTHELVTAVAEVVLRDYLGYTVETLVNDVTSTSMWGFDMINLDLYDVDMEAWQVLEGSENFVKYVDADLVLLVGSTGFTGRSGIFISDAALAQARYAGYYRFYLNATTAAGQGLLLHDAGSFQGSDCTMDWCGSGLLEGFWAPTACQEDAGKCGQLIHTRVSRDTGYVEQLLEQNGLQLVVGYFGDHAEQMIRTYVQAGAVIPFYWWEPDVLVAQLNVTRVSFPDYFDGCDVPNTASPETGSIACDFPEVAPMKIARGSLRRSAPEALYALQLFEVGRDELEEMMAEHESVGGLMSTAALVCQWFSTNLAMLEEWAPECLRNPIAFEDLTVDSIVFDPEQLACGPTKSCPPSSILRFLDGFVCEECGPGDVPDPSQKSCVTCLPGYEENVNGSACVSCPPGTAKDVGEVECSSCAAGFYTAVAGKSQCDFCTGATFQASQGQTGCQSCDLQYVGSVALLPGATSQEQCDCPAGKYLALGGQACIPCPLGFECPDLGAKEANFPAGGNSSIDDDSRRYPIVAYGYMTLSQEPLRVYLCQEERRCPGGPPGSCAPFRNGKVVACGECMNNAYESGEKCIECDGADVVPLIIAVVVGLLLVAMSMSLLHGNILMRSNDTLLLTVLGGLILTALQTLVVIRQVSIQWMEPFLSLLSLVSVFSFRMDLLRFGCIVGSAPVSTYLLRQCVVPVATVVILGGLQVKKRFVPATNLQVEFVNTMGLVTSIFLISIAASALAPHVCYEHPGTSGRSVISDPSILCDYSGPHIAIVLIGLVATLIVLLPYFVLVFYGVLQYRRIVRRSIKSDEFLAAFRFLFVRYHPRAYWFAIVAALRSLLLCLTLVIFDVAAAQVMAIASVLTVYMMTQQTVQPWRAPLANFLDMAFGFGLSMLLLAVSVLSDFSQGTVAVKTTGVLSLILTLVSGPVVLLQMKYKRWNATRYQEFLCHHKDGAAAQVRLLKMLLVARHGKNVFIDSDNLLELTALFDVIKTKIQTLVVYLTRDTLTRPWCVGEICTAFNSRKRIVMVSAGSWHTPEESKIDELPGLVKEMPLCSLKELGITSELMARSLRHVVSYDASTVCLDGSHPGCMKFMKVAQRVAEESLQASSNVHSTFLSRVRKSPAWHGNPGVGLPAPAAAKVMESAPGCLVACADPGDDEALAAVSILLMKSNDKVAALGVPCTVNITDHGADPSNPTLVMDALEATHEARAVVVILSRGSLECFLQVSVIVAGMHTACTMIPVHTWDFQFPGASYFATQLPRLWRDQIMLTVTKAEQFLKGFFSIITVNFSTMGSDKVLTLNADSVVSRIPHDYRPHTIGAPCFAVYMGDGDASPRGGSKMVTSVKTMESVSDGVDNTASCKTFLEQPSVATTKMKSVATIETVLSDPLAYTLSCPNLEQPGVAAATASTGQEDPDEDEDILFANEV